MKVHHNYCPNFWKLLWTVINYSTKFSHFTKPKLPATSAIYKSIRFLKNTYQRIEQENLIASYFKAILETTSLHKISKVKSCYYRKAFHEDDRLSHLYKAKFYAYVHHCSKSLETYLKTPVKNPRCVIEIWSSTYFFGLKR